MEEKKEKVLKAVDKIMNILLELSPDELLTVSAFLQMILPGKPPMSVSMMAGRLFGGPSQFGRFR